MKPPCAQCPWRVANHGKRTPWGFYRKDNLRRLWNQIRRGGRRQSCHVSDPNHPDHRLAGAKEGSEPHECRGSLILIQRELRALANGATVLDGHHVEEYLVKYPRGLTRQGIGYFLLSRQMDPPFGEGRMSKVPEEMLDDEGEYGRYE